jgi:hypothetical protein
VSASFYRDPVIPPVKQRMVCLPQTTEKTLSYQAGDERSIRWLSLVERQNSTGG